MKHVALVCITTLLLFAQCAPQLRVYSDQDPDYRVAAFRTFDWKQKIDIEANRNPLYYNELNDKRIKAAVSHELSDHGYVLSESAPDMLVHYHIVINDQSVITTEPYGYFYGPYWMHMRTNVYTYQEGSLIIDITDAKTNNLVWRGWATAALDEIDPENTKEIIGRAVAKIFRKFPDAVKRPDEIISTKRME